MVALGSARLTQYPASRSTRARSSSSGTATRINLLHRLGDVSDFGFGQRLRRPPAGGIELVVDQAAPPGIRDPRTVIDVGHLIGDGQNAGDMVRSRKAGHADVSTPVLLCKVWQRRRGSQSSSRIDLETGPHGVMRSRSCRSRNPSALSLAKMSSPPPTGSPAPGINAAPARSRPCKPNQGLREICHERPRPPR